MLPLLYLLINMKNITFKEIPDELYYKTVELKGRLQCRNWEVFLEKVCKIVEDEMDAPKLQRIDSGGEDR